MPIEKAKSLAAAVLLAWALGLAATAPGQATTTSSPPASGALAQPPRSTSAPATAAKPTAAQPKPSPQAPPATQAIDYAKDQAALAVLQSQLPSVANDARLAEMGRQAAAIQAAADAVLASREAQLAKVQAQLRPLELRRRLRRHELDERAELTAQAARLQAQIAQPQALAALAGQTFSMIAERRRQGFSARVLAQTASPLSPDFWAKLASASGSDFGRLEAMISESLATALEAPEPRGIGGLAMGLIVAVALCWPLRRRLERLGWAAAHRLSLGEAARTLAVIWTATLDIGAAVIAAAALRLGAKWGGLLSDDADAIARAFIGAVAWGVAIPALGRALATNRYAERRLLNVSDAEASRARAVLVIVALITAAGLLLRRLNYQLGASLAATIAANCVISLAYAGAAALILISFSRGAGTPASPLTVTQPTRPAAWTLAAMVLAAAIVVTVGAILLGYTTLAALISGQIFWLSLIAAVAYLLLKLIDDVCGAIFQAHSRSARALSRIFGFKMSTVVQIGLLVSAAVQLIIIFATVILALTPFGQSGELLMTHMTRLGASLRIGKATISPLAIAAGVVTFAFGMSLVHIARTWVVRRYLPATDWDAGVRNSVSTGVAYLGVAIAVSCALAVTGLGFQQIALIASALSVGIGFGLQQIVQNFVAGVILLIERPVKVGDWINVSGVEGDVSRIRVRATEIKAADKSTVIVPNSSLITMNVQNKSLAWPHAQVRLQISVRDPTHAKKAREVMLELAGAKESVLKDPPPRALIDALADSGAANLSLWLGLADPRDAGRVKSELYLEIIDAFQAEQILLGTGA